MYNLPKQFLSASQINKYLSCPRQYEYEYVNQVEVPKRANEAMAVGSSVHKYVETLIKKMLSNELKPQELNDILEEASLDVNSIIDSPDLELEQSKEKVSENTKNLFKVWHKELSSVILPSKSEHKFESFVGDVPVMGYIDYVDHSAGKEEICDLKVSDKSKTLSDAKNSVQLAMYSIVESNPCVRFDSIVKTKVPKLVQVRHTFSDGELGYFTDLIGEVATNISRSNFPRTSPTSWNCTENWCSFYNICRGSYDGKK